MQQQPKTPRLNLEWVCFMCFIWRGWDCRSWRQGLTMDHCITMSYILDKSCSPASSRETARGSSQRCMCVTNSIIHIAKHILFKPQATTRKRWHSAERDFPFFAWCSTSSYAHSLRRSSSTMVAILIRNIKMSRPVLQNKPDDCRDEASLHEDDLDDDIRGILSSSWSPIPSQPDDDATTTAATLTTNAIGTMSDTTQEQRLQPDDVPTEEGGQDQHQKQLSSSSRLNPTMRPATPKTLSQHEQELKHEMKAADYPSHQYMYHPINHRYYQSRYQYSHSGASSYNTHPEFDNHTSATASTMIGSGQQYHHHHQLTYPSYYTAQDYGNYSNHPYDNHYSYYESRGSGDDLSPYDPGPTQQYAHYYPQHYNHGAATSPSSYHHHNHHQHHHTFPHHGLSSGEATPSRVVSANTTAKGGTTPSSSYTSHKSTTHSSDGRKSLDLSSSPVDEDRKPSARSEKQADTKERKCAAKRRRDEGVLVSYPPDSQQQGQDFEPIPLNKISAIPILSSSSSSRDIASSSSYGGSVGGGRGGTISYSNPASSCSSPPAAVGSSSRSSGAHVAPPRPHATASTPASRKQPRILEPSSGGSNDTTCSTSWDKRFSELIDFKRVHGHCEVPQNYAENTSLGTWVNKVRGDLDDSCLHLCLRWATSLIRFSLLLEFIISNEWSKRIDWMERHRPLLTLGLSVSSPLAFAGRSGKDKQVGMKNL